MEKLFPLIDTGDTAWMLFSAALVMLLTHGISLYYGGMARARNVLGTMMHGLVLLCVVSVVWVACGYAAAFGGDRGGVIGGVEWFWFSGIGSERAQPAETVPNGTFAMFHGFLAVVAVSLISGSFAERMKFKAFLLFSTLWVFFVYTPLAHWVWGGGWTGGVLGALDFAGGIPIQISAGAAALVAAYVVKPRKGYGIDPMPPHNRTTALAGAALMWFGWIGLNAGSANGAGTLAAFALVNTNVSAAASALCWCLIERLHRGKSTLVGMAGGLIAGLAAASPAAGYVHPLSSIAIGVVAGVLSYIAISLKPRIGYDDAFDVFGIHAVGGTWGMLATGLFASREINPSGLDGLFHGNPPLLGIQAAAIIAAYIYVVIYTFVILKIVDWTIGLRVSGEDEIAGMDQTQHGERAYNLRGDKY